MIINVKSDNKKIFFAIQIIFREKVGLLSYIF